MTDKKTRNQSLELAKVTAACFVVFIHVSFPEPLGMAVDCIARFAVPLFFAVSGYYSLGIGVGKIKKRVIHLLKLHVLAAVLSLAVGSLIRYSQEGTAASALDYLVQNALPSLYQLSQWMLLQINPYGGQLWYLSSLLLCYLVLWGYTVFWEGEKQDNRPLYLVSMSLFAVYFTMSNLLLVDGVALPFRTYMNGWLTGLPLFVLGMFLREHEARLISRFRLTVKRSCLLIGLGFLLSLIQSFGGFHTQLPLGMVLVVPVLLLVLVQNPQIPVRSAWVQGYVSRLGMVSTAIYLLHIPIMDLYNVFLLDRVYGIFTTKEDTLRPVIVLMLTLLVSFAWERIDWCLDRRK